MQITNELRRNTEASASPVQLSLYAGSEAGGRLRTIAEQFGIDNEDAYTIFAVAAGDVVLGLVPPDNVEEMLHQRLPGLSGVMAAGLSKAIVSYANPALSQGTQPVQEQSALASEINDLEETVAHLEPVRTMASDMQAHTPEEETLHSSSQDNLLQHEPIEAGPRWDSDTSE